MCVSRKRQLFTIVPRRQRAKRECDIVSFGEGSYRPKAVREEFVSCSCDSARHAPLVSKTLSGTCSRALLKGHSGVDFCLAKEDLTVGSKLYR